MPTYECLACGYVYDPAVGDPGAGIVAGTPFDDLPDDWVCPECGVSKDMFGPLEWAAVVRPAEIEESAESAAGGDRLEPKRYECLACGYVYDPAIGDSDAGIVAGTPFDHLPDDWVCPECGVGKDMFEPLESAAVVGAAEIEESAGSATGGDRLELKRYECLACGYVYDPAIGDPDAGIVAGTPFEDLPEDWTCPECGVGKDMFEVLA